MNELNDLNTKIYIDNNKYKYKKYFIPEQKGKYIIKLEFTTSLTDCSYMFAGCNNILEINFISFNTKYVTNMEYMFYKCKNLKTVNLSSFDTKKIINMNHMFAECSNLDYLDLSSFDTKNVII